MSNILSELITLIEMFRHWRKKCPILLVFIGLVAPVVAADDALLSWNDGPSKSAIVEFVESVTDKTRASYVPPERHIATFDNDGTLWPSHTMSGSGFSRLIGNPVKLMKAFSA